MKVLPLKDCRHWIVPVALVQHRLKLNVGCSFSQCSMRRHLSVSPNSVPLQHRSSLRIPVIGDGAKYSLSRVIPSLRHSHSPFPVRLYASSSDDNTRDGNDSSSMHQLYLQQIQELELERVSLFGDAEVNKSDSHATIEIDNTAKPEYAAEDVSPNIPIVDESMKLDREALFAFTADERLAWSQVVVQSSSSMDQSVDGIARDIKQNKSSAPRGQHPLLDAPATFTHLSSNGQNVQMVDVGSKAVTHRTATAQSVVVFPPEVLLAFGTQHVDDDMNVTTRKEWMGKKGPIFATAITAGIMGVKQTSSLIPLCHPLPLENVSIDIVWSTKDSVRITCTCSATHKTGVEMEALMGCSIAALTIYDMVKAVSHNVHITDTQLLHKAGGKRLVDGRVPQ